MVKKWITKGIIILITLAIVVIGGITIYYFATTMSAQACINYCIENSTKHATKFEPLGDGRYAYDYVYWVAVDGDPDSHQEIFIFKDADFGFFYFKRYRFVDSKNYSDGLNDKVGCIEYYTQNDEGEKEKTSTLIYYGSSREADIVRCEYTLTINDGSNTYSKYIKCNPSGAWVVKFFDICDFDDNHKKVISSISFYDSEDNLVCTMS